MERNKEIWQNGAKERKKGNLRRRRGGLIRKIYSVAEPLSRFVEWIRGACPPGF